MYSNALMPLNQDDPDFRENPRNRKNRLRLRKLFHVEQFDRKL